MKVSRNELFAPALTISGHDTFEEAVMQINDSIYGLRASVFTNNIRHVSYAYEHLEVGGVIVNDVPRSKPIIYPTGVLRSQVENVKGRLCHGRDDRTKTPGFESVIKKGTFFVTCSIESERSQITNNNFHINPKIPENLRKENICPETYL
ncbi:MULTISPECIES: aldehyde dehydrogenase family protein [Candidatus Brocadia]|nr:MULTISPECIES: aldehyde dehydrogenase family protein [Brocadia]GJQ18871.1 MAG: hypothetical protein HBSIN01_28300 [Candidatus Brocadia sinica]